MKIFSSILILCMGLLHPSFAQFDLLGHLSQDALIRNTINPSVGIESDFRIGLPGVYHSSRSRGPLISDVFALSGNTNRIQASAILDHLDADNHYQNFVDVQGLSLHSRILGTTISLGYNVKFLAFAAYNDAIMKLLFGGNAQYLDQEISIGPNIGLQSYHELYMGVAKKFGRLSLGGRVKVLSGIEDVSTAARQIHMRTDGLFYEWQFDNDFQINSSGVLELTDLSSIEIDFDPIRFVGLRANIGYAVDLGLQLDINERWSVAASILDIGSIQWTKRVKNYSSTGSYTYDGVDLLNLIETNNEYQLQDSLYNILRFQETELTYATTLATRFYISSQYHIDTEQSIGVVYYRMAHRGPSQWSLAIQYQRLLGAFSITTQYAYINKNPYNVGLGVGIKLGKFYINLYSDNILGLADILSSRSTNYRAAASIAF